MDTPPKLYDLAFKVAIGRYTSGDILSRETKQGLQVLDISGHEPFRDNWMEVVPSMFPKLKVLNINNRKLCEENFAHLCNNFPNLHTLHIGNHKLKSLEGISKLTSLENLVIGVSCFRKETDVTEIFKLRNLKSLTISENLHPGWDYQFFFLKPLPELTHLEIQWKGADDEFLERILPSLPKLKSVVANRTKIEGFTTPPSVTVYITTNLNTTMKSLAYFRSIGNRKEVLKALSKFVEIYEDNGEEEDEEKRLVCTPDQLTVCMNEVELLLEKFKFDEKVVERVNRCVDIFACFAANGEHLSDNKLKILNILLKNLANDLKNDNIPAFSILGFIWKLIRNLTRNIENLNIDKIASLAMESIAYGGECLDDWQYSCAVILAEFIDRTDFSSGYYKESSFRKLYKCLTKMHKNDYWLQESRTSVVKVMKYIEIFM
ncbi:hypothetical protein CAEBREN_22173 [Caenorhabditis brenneri]|uniref:Uncharacterized protein n=1 Tax=Caenorhabditis brenneri TaxID=135651 RepID=G0PCV7_CAEBE|nr:hypothetical protein CAEBREN_22173 [Caenorhabditis brenneri]